MEFKNYNIYSMISNNAKQNEQSLSAVLKLIEAMGEKKKIAEAKEYIKSTWNLNECVTKYPIGANCVLTTKENNKLFKVQFEYKDENITYCYKK